MTTLDSFGIPPLDTTPRSVMAQTPRRLSKVPFGSSEFIKYSAAGVPLLIAGCTDAAIAPPMLNLSKCTKSTDLDKETSCDLEIAYICAPLNPGPIIGNSFVLI